MSLEDYIKWRSQRVGADREDIPTPRKSRYYKVKSAINNNFLLIFSFIAIGAVAALSDFKRMALSLLLITLSVTALVFVVFLIGVLKERFPRFYGIASFTLMTLAGILFISLLTVGYIEFIFDVDILFG